MQLCVIFQVTSFKDKVTCFRLLLPLVVVQLLSCAQLFSTPWTSSSPGKRQKLRQRTWTLGWKLLNEKGRLNRPWSKATYSPTQPWATSYLRLSVGRKRNFYLCLSLCLESLCHNSLSCGYIKSWWANILLNVTKVNNSASLVAQLVKNLPAMQETWVRSLGQEDLLEKETATHSSTLAWRIPQTVEPGRLQSMGWQELDTT